MLNDYFDFLNGQDYEKWLLIDENHELTRIKLTDIPKVACLLTGIASITGIWLALQTNLWIIPIGIMSIAAGIKYSAGKRSFAAIALGEVTAFVCLGIIVTTVAYFIQTNHLTLNILLVSIVFGLLIVTMILTNNIYDIVKDEPHRITLAILLGKKHALYLLVVIMILLYSTIIYDYQAYAQHYFFTHFNVGSYCIETN